MKLQLSHSKIMNSLQNSHKNYKILSIKYAKKLKNPGIHICIFITLLSFSVKQTTFFLNVALDAYEARDAKYTV